MKDLSVKFSLEDSAYITALRLVAGVVCSAHDIDVDAAEDFKVCVTESVIILKESGFKEAEVVFGGADAVCTVTGFCGSPKECENEFSLALISALVRGCDIDRKDGAIYKITLKL